MDPSSKSTLNRLNQKTIWIICGAVGGSLLVIIIGVIFYISSIRPVAQNNKSNKNPSTPSGEKGTDDKNVLETILKSATKLQTDEENSISKDVGQQVVDDFAQLSDERLEELLKEGAIPSSQSDVIKMTHKEAKIGFTNRKLKSVGSGGQAGTKIKDWKESEKQVIREVMEIYPNRIIEPQVAEQVRVQLELPAPPITPTPTNTIPHSSPDKPPNSQSNQQQQTSSTPDSTKDDSDHITEPPLSVQESVPDENNVPPSSLNPNRSTLPDDSNQQPTPNQPSRPLPQPTPDATSAPLDSDKVVEVVKEALDKFKTNTLLVDIKYKVALQMALNSRLHYSRELELIQAALKCFDPDLKLTFDNSYQRFLSSPTVPDVYLLCALFPAVKSALGSTKTNFLEYSMDEIGSKTLENRRTSINGILFLICKIRSSTSKEPLKRILESIWPGIKKENIDKIFQYYKSGSPLANKADLLDKPLSKLEEVLKAITDTDTSHYTILLAGDASQISNSLEKYFAEDCKEKLFQNLLANLVPLDKQQVGEIFAETAKIIKAPPLVLQEIMTKRLKSEMSERFKRRAFSEGDVKIINAYHEKIVLANSSIPISPFIIWELSSNFELTLKTLTLSDIIKGHDALILKQLIDKILDEIYFPTFNSKVSFDNLVQEARSKFRDPSNAPTDEAINKILLGALESSLRANMVYLEASVVISKLDRLRTIFEERNLSSDLKNIQSEAQIRPFIESRTLEGDIMDFMRNAYELLVMTSHELPAITVPPKIVINSSSVMTMIEKLGKNSLLNAAKMLVGVFNDYQKSKGLNERLYIYHVDVKPASGTSIIARNSGVDKRHNLIDSLSAYNCYYFVDLVEYWFVVLNLKPNTSYELFDKDESKKLCTILIP